MEPSSPSPAHPSARSFALGAVFGLLLGAFIVSAIVWRFGNVIGSHAASIEYPPHLPAAVDRWSDGVDDAGEGVIVDGRTTPAGDAPAGTSGSAAVAVPAPSPEPVVGAPSVSALADRDLLIPVEGVSADQLVRSFADTRGSRTHEAIDILAPRGTPVRAVEDGTIARLFYSKAGGITIYQFDPGETYTYYYAHLDRYAEGLAEGNRVNRGQIIGYVGVTGNAPKDTPHLHFAIFRLTAEKRWWEGTPIDPYDVLR